MAGLLVGLSVLAAPARTFLSQDEALAQAFPGATVERRTVVLTEPQLARAAQLAGEKIKGSLIHPYVAVRDGRPVGTAYFDAHKVRTLPETLMVVLDPAGRVVQVRVLAFNEPLDYLASDAWYAQFGARALDDELQLRRGIDGITGATLTARATTRAVRRILALHEAIQEAARGAP